MPRTAPHSAVDNIDRGRESGGSEGGSSSLEKMASKVSSQVTSLLKSALQESASGMLREAKSLREEAALLRAGKEQAELECLELKRGVRDWLRRIIVEKGGFISSGDLPPGIAMDDAITESAGAPSPGERMLPAADHIVS